MASGDPVGLITQITAPETGSSAPSRRSGGSTPAESVPIWTFNAAADEYIDLYLWLLGYDNASGISLKGAFMMASATTGNVRLGVAPRRANDDGENLTAAHTYVFQEITSGVASIAGEPKYFTIDISHANLDGWLNNEYGILRFRREGTDGVNDTASGNMELLESLYVVQQ